MFNIPRFLQKQSFLSISKTVFDSYPNKKMSTNTNTAYKKPKYDGRTKKRKWEERRTDKGATLYAEKRVCDENFVRIKRRKYALLLGYSGVDYLGMQRNPGYKTIEEDLFTALLKADLITEESYNQVQQIQYQRAARTDKGVSAARQVVSVKLPEAIDIAQINANLPEVIKVFGAKRATQGFNSKNQCDGRTYMYMLPTVAFAKTPDETQENFRLSADDLATINAVFANFIGTKNYHNFTHKKKPNDPSAKRYILKFECETPFVRKGVEFAVIKVKGQSFMMHQIRKMIGLALAVVRGLTAEEILKKAWTLEKLNIPKAPGLGLVLDKVHYEKYDYRYGKDGVHETLEWSEADAQVEEFKEKHIYPIIIDTEIKEQIMINWIGSRLMGHDFYNVPDPNKEEEEDNGDEEEDNGDDDCDATVQTEATEQKT